jgi:hypothetical protein
MPCIFVIQNVHVWQNVARHKRAHWRSALFLFAEAYFDRLKLKNFELKFKFAKYKSCRPINHLQLLQRPTYQIVNRFGVTDFLGSVKLFSRALAGFLKV